MPALRSALPGGLRSYRSYRIARSRGRRREPSNEGPVIVGAEMALELTYQAQLNKWLSIRPDLQVIINPGRNNDLNNGIVVGGRASITF